MNTMQTVGVIIAIVLIAGLAILTGMRSKKGSAKINCGVVAGLIMGTLVGGSSTVGTAQLAYTYGMAAWWFTLGGGIACLVLAVGYVKALRMSNCTTLIGIITQEYGNAAGMTASVLNSVGTFINVLSQLISATAVIAVIMPSVKMVPALFISAGFMILYVVFGGTKGAGIVGILKLALLYIAMLGCGAIVLSLTGGLGGFVDMVNGIDNPEGVHFFNLFARSVGEDAGAGLSLILGVLTTQTYAQAIINAKSMGHARAGALISTVLIPPIGIGGILVGLYMRANFPGIDAKTALTQFVMEQVPSLLGGLILGTLFIAVVGTGAGLALGISTVLNRDIVQKVTKKFEDPKKENLLVKMMIVLVLVLAAVLSAVLGSEMILNFAFLSMALRGATVFAPLCCALWLKGRIDRKFAMVAIIGGPAIVAVFGFLDCLSFDPLFLGIAIAIVVMAVGLLAGKNNRKLGQSA